MSIDPETQRFRRQQHNNDPITEPIPVIREQGSPAQRPEAFRSTPLREAAGRHFADRATHPRFPDHVPAHVVANPDNAAAREVVPQTREKAGNKSKAIIATIAGVAVLGAGGGFALYEGAKSGTEATLKDAFGKNNPTNTIQTTEAPTPPEFINGLKVSFKETPAYQTIDQFPKYDSELPAARDMMLDPNNHLLTPEQTALLSLPLATDLRSASSQQVENIASYHLFDLSSQGTETTTLGRQYLDIEIDPRNPNNGKIADMIEGGQVGIISANRALSNHPRKTSFTFMNDSVSDGWVIEEQDVHTGIESVTVFEDVVSAGGHEEIVVRDSYDLNDPAVRAEILRNFGQS